MTEEEVCNRAKAILMQRVGLTEGEAHRELQKRAQNGRVKKVDVARRILDAEELFYGLDSSTR